MLPNVRALAGGYRYRYSLFLNFEKFLSYFVAFNEFKTLIDKKKKTLFLKRHGLVVKITARDKQFSDDTINWFKVLIIVSVS